ncbi:MAG TPA: PucR family transcriptional regulator ligand-binding domain-containing protein [Candidatus Baltobacteraceae bacterium]|jgi:purine catabolism regulator|nr:PucR family transcriptional regulator ligand-binding domain-containing protein [Candidatus Baltobacteraceae bacterium]
MKLKDVLDLPSLQTARVVAGRSGLDRDVLWSHVVDMPDPIPWVRPGFMILTSGYAWPKSDEEQRLHISSLATAGVAAFGMAVPKFVDEFSETAREQADLSGLPLLEIPWEVPFVRITEELHKAVTAEPYRIIERSEQIHRALTRAATRNASLDDLAKSLCGLINRSVTFEDPSGKLLAHCSVDESHDDVRRETLEHAQTPQAMMRALERSGMARHIRAAEKPLRVPAMPEVGSAARVVCPIRIGSELAGMVWIIEGASPLSELDHRAAEHAALVAAIHIAHQRELASVESRLGYASFLSLLESEPGEKPVAEERVRLLGFDPRGRYRVGIVRVPEELPLGREAVLRRDRIAARVRDALKQMNVEQLVTVNLNNVPFLLPENKPVEPIAQALGDSSLQIVLGRVHDGADGVRRSYREALSLFSYRYRPAICSYDDLLVPRVITGDAKARETFLDDLFAPLRVRKNGENLAQALLTLARNGFHFRQTAQVLAIHPNTLRYRLDRATEALQIDLDDPDVRFRLQLATRLLDIEQREW